MGRYLLTEPTADYSSITLATINSLIDYSEQAVTCDKLTVNSNGSIKLEGCFVFGSVNSEQTFIYENGLISKTKYIVYDVGSEIIVNNEHYYVISDFNDDWLGGPHTQHWIYDPDNNEYNGWYIAWQQFHSYPAGRTKFIIDVCLRPVINVKKSAIESSD